MLFHRKGQSTAEYAIIIGVVVGAIMAVGVFLRGGIEAKVRTMTNQYLNGTTLNTATGVVNSSYNTTSNSMTEVSMNNTSTGSIITVGGGGNNATGGKDVTTRVGKTTYFGK